MKKHSSSLPTPKVKKATKLERAAIALLESRDGVSTVTAAQHHNLWWFRDLVHELRKRGVQLRDELCISPNGARFKRTSPATAEDKAKLLEIVATEQRKRGLQ